MPRRKKPSGDYVFVPAASFMSQSFNGGTREIPQPDARQSAEQQTGRGAVEPELPNVNPAPVTPDREGPATAARKRIVNDIVGTLGQHFDWNATAHRHAARVIEAMLPMTYAEADEALDAVRDPEPIPEAKVNAMVARVTMPDSLALAAKDMLAALEEAASTLAILTRNDPPDYAPNLTLKVVRAAIAAAKGGA